MTTVAWDGKSLAADTRATAGAFPFRNTKLWQLNDGRLYAACGEAEDCEAVHQWLNNPVLPKPAVKDFTGLVIDKKRCWRYGDKLVPVEVLEPFHAIGSGRDYAISAMAFGRNAREAVEFATHFDVATGCPVDTLPAE